MYMIFVHKDYGYIVSFYCRSNGCCDLRCFPYCFTCIDVCSCCMRTIPTGGAIPIYYGAKLEAKVAIACGSQCSRYLTSTSCLPVILYKPKEAGQIVLQVCTNGVLFGLTDSKGKFIIHYLTLENSDRITVWCQYRLWCTQYVYTMLFDGNCDVVDDHSISTSFTELFTDSEGRKKFRQFVKDTWQFYQSLLLKPLEDDMEHNHVTSQAEDGFEYFATMPTNHPIHVPLVHEDEDNLQHK